ncbi:MAG: DUF1800 domain-containing protein [Chloroflexota bacterium]
MNRHNIQQERGQTQMQPQDSHIPTESSSSPAMSRRRFIQALGVSTMAGAAAATMNTPLLPSTQAEVSAAPLLTAPLEISDDPDLHVLRRLTFSPTPESLMHIQDIGRDAFIEEQLAPETIDDSEMDAILAHFPLLTMTNAEIMALPNKERNQSRNQLQYSTLLRAVYSKRQLFELMVDFWNNHLNTHINAGRVKFYKINDDRDVIRANALGRYSDMLLASAQSLAMLTYLNNNTSRATSPNENYGRELLELHTLGEDDGYTEEDVRNAAYVLTGWTYDRKTHTFMFKEKWHYEGALQVKEWSTEGKSGPEGIEDGISLLNYLANHPSTANRLAYKLCVRFLGENPPADVVAAAAQAYLDNGTEIKPMLRAIFNSASFNELSYIGSKFRRPFEFMTAVMRIYDAQLTEDVPNKAPKTLRNQLSVMGQPIFGWGPPNGYPDAMGAWVNSTSLLARWNFTQKLLTRNRKHETLNKFGILIDYRALIGGSDVPRPETAGELVDMLAGRLLFQSISDSDRDILLGYVGVGADELVPEKFYNHTLSQVAALLVNSPYFQFR